MICVSLLYNSCAISKESYKSALPLESVSSYFDSTFSTSPKSALIPFKIDVVAIMEFCIAFIVESSCGFTVYSNVCCSASRAVLQFSISVVICPFKVLISSAVAVPFSASPFSSSSIIFNWSRTPWICILVSSSAVPSQLETESLNIFSR